MLSSVKLNKNFLRRAIEVEGGSLFSRSARKWKGSCSGLLSTLFTLKGGQFSLRINCTWSCMAHSEDDVSVLRSRERKRALFRMLVAEDGEMS